MDADAKERQYLSADALYRLVRATFAADADARSAAAAIPLGDALMATSGFRIDARCPGDKGIRPLSRYRGGR